MDFSNRAKVVVWNNKKKFGFAEANGERYFFHISAIDIASQNPKIGDTIIVEKFGTSPKGPRIDKGKLDISKTSQKKEARKKDNNNKDSKKFYISVTAISIVSIVILSMFFLKDDKQDNILENKVQTEIIQLRDIEFGGSYTTKDDVAQYLCQFGRLPKNYVDRFQAQTIYEKKTGRIFTEWNFNPFAVIGLMIGGDYTSEVKGCLPEGHWFEADVDYDDSSRGTKRLIYNGTCNIYYTKDLNNTFSKIVFR